MPLEPQTGRLDGAVHSFPIRVYYEDTDAGGVVYHAAYLRFAERARAEFLRVLGWPHERVRRETGCAFAVRRVALDYRRPGRLDDALVVATRLSGLAGVRMTAEQSVLRGRELLAQARLELVLVNDAGRPARVPAVLRDAFLPLLELKESASDPCQSIP